MRARSLARFEEWKSDVNVPAMLFSRVAEGETLAGICKEQEIVFSLVSQWIAQTPALRAQYDAALKIWADRLAQETIGIVDGATPDTVGVAKLRAEQRNKLAGKLDRERYGERDAGGVKVEINLGNVAAEIAALEQRLGVRTIDVTPQPAALPIPHEPAEAAPI